MAATLTKIGDGVWGIPSAETGILVESISFSYTSDQKEIRDRQGHVCGVAIYNDRYTVNIDGHVPSGTVFTGAVGSLLSLANTAPSHLKGGVAGGSLIVTEVSREMAVEEYQTLSISATFYPSV